MEVVKAILESRGLGLSDVIRAIAKFKQAAGAAALARWCAANGVTHLTAVVIESDIWRHDLLFEIELAAMA